MFKQFSEVEAFVKQHDIQMIDLKFCDLWGRWHHVTLPSPAFTESILSEGVGFDG